MNNDSDNHKRVSTLNPPSFAGSRAAFNHNTQDEGNSGSWSTWLMGEVCSYSYVTLYDVWRNRYTFTRWWRGAGGGLKRAAWPFARNGRHGGRTGADQALEGHRD